VRPPYANSNFGKKENACIVIIIVMIIIIGLMSGTVVLAIIIGLMSGTVVLAMLNPCNALDCCALQHSVPKATAPFSWHFFCGSEP
jgi:hypothetical protein